MVIFHSYVSLPEGTTSATIPGQGRASVLQHNLPAPEAELVRPPPIPPRPMRQPGGDRPVFRHQPWVFGGLIGYPLVNKHKP